MLRKTFVSEKECESLHRCVCVYLCVYAIQISFWSLRKPEINRSQSAFRRLDRQFCFKTSKHHLYSTFRAHKCLSDIYERQRERGRERWESKKKKGKKEREGTGLFLTPVKGVEQHTDRKDRPRVMEQETGVLFSSLDNRKREEEDGRDKKHRCIE